MATIVGTRETSLQATSPRLTTSTGYNAVTLTLSSYASVVTANSAGTVPSYPTGVTLRLFQGGTLIPSGVTYGPASTTQNGLTVAVNSTSGVLTISGASWTTTQESFALTATYNGEVYSITYSITKALTGLGGQNLIPNSDNSFRTNAIIGWNPNAVTGVEGPMRAVDATHSWSTSDWELEAGVTRNVYARQGAPTAGTVGGTGNSAVGFDIHPTGTYSIANSIPVVAGKRYMFSAYLALLSCNASVMLLFVDVGGNTLAPGSYEGALIVGSTGFANRLDLYQRAFVTAVAPANAVAAFPIIRKRNTFSGQTESFIWYAAPMFEEISATATEPSPYIPGPTSSANQLGYVGDLDAERNNRISINPNGTLTGAGGGQVNLASLPGAIVSSQIADGAVNVAKFATGIEPIEIFSVLPSTGNFAGRTVFLTTDNKLYRHTGSAWTAAVDGADITANTITAGKIQTGAIGTDQLAANSVTTGKILVRGQGAALNADPNTQDITAWAGGTFTLVTDSTAPTGRALEITSTGANTLSATAFNIDSTKTYDYRVSVKQQSGTSTVLLGVAFYDASGSQILGSSDTVGWVPGTYHYFGLVNQNPTTSWVEYRVAFGPGESRGIPSAAKSMSLVILANFSGTGAQRFSNLRVTQRISGELIVDGAITTAKLAANAVTANEIAAGAIRAQHLLVAPKGLNLDPTFARGSPTWTGFVRRLDQSNAAVPTGCPVSHAAEFNLRDNFSSDVEIDVVPGEVYRASCWVNRGTGSTGQALGIFGAFRSASGATVQSIAWPGSTTANGWVRVTGTYVVPANSARMIFGPWADRPSYTGEAWYADLQIEKVNDSSLIVDGAVTAAKISVTDLAAVSANLGTVNISTSGSLRSGQTAYNTGSGFWMGIDGGTAKFSIGTAGGNRLTWDGTALLVTTDSSNLVTTGAISRNYSVFGSNISGTAAASFRFGTDGVVAKNTNGGSYANDGNWYSPTTTSIGSNYWVRFSRVSGPSPNNGGALLNVWSQLNTNRVIGHSTTLTTAQVVVLNYEISSSSSGSPLLSSGTLTINVIIE